MIDESVNELVDGAYVMDTWLSIPASRRSATVQQERVRLAAIPSPLREYQSCMEALAVLNEYANES